MTSEATLCPRVLSIHVGRPRCFDTGGDSDKPWTSGIIKTAVEKPVHVGRLNIDGDKQADLRHHGGPDKAVLAYCYEHFARWSIEFPAVRWSPGSFGENLTLADCTESDVCIGNMFELGDCLLQVSQPRQPCWKLSRRWNIPKLAVRVQQTRRTGWYYRVIREGIIEAGQSMVLMERPHPEWTIQVANEVMFAKPRNAADDFKLASCPLLSESWRDTLTKRSRQSEKKTRIASGFGWADRRMID